MKNMDFIRKWIFNFEGNKRCSKVKSFGKESHTKKAFCLRQFEIFLFLGFLVFILRLEEHD